MLAAAARAPGGLPHGREAQRGGARAARDVPGLPDGQRVLRYQRALYGGLERPDTSGSCYLILIVT